MESNPAAFNAAITAAASIASCSVGYAMQSDGGAVVFVACCLAVVFAGLAMMANSKG